MREIKLRAWDKEKKEMYIMVLPQTHDEVPMMQYTGLKDKNGREIYEGDIIRFKDYVGGILADKIEAVEWMNTWEGDGQRMTGFVLPTRESSEVEIIGNTHENPELLK